MSNEQSKQATPSKYGVCVFLKPEQSNVFADKRGNKSIIAAQVRVPIVSIGLTMEAAVWARLTTTPEGTKITFEASLPSRAFTRAISPAEIEARDEALAHIENAAAVWVGWEAATAIAESKLTGQAVKVVSKRPNLVKDVKPVTAPVGQTTTPTAPTA